MCYYKDLKYLINKTIKNIKLNFNHFLYCKHIIVRFKLIKFLKNKLIIF